MAALKSLREEGFEVTGFERRSDVGGLWTFDADPEVTSTTTGRKGWKSSPKRWLMVHRHQGTNQQIRCE
jgi:cation diffusion facilitator CzcD-associated flavoprotein CzcO